MDHTFNSVAKASGHVSRAVLMKAGRKQGLSIESIRIANEVFVKGYRQATVARHVGVSRQRVHTVCRMLLDEINAQLAKDVDAKKSSDRSALSISH